MHLLQHELYLYALCKTLILNQRARCVTQYTPYTNKFPIHVLTD